MSIDSCILNTVKVNNQDPNSVRNKKDFKKQWGIKKKWMSSLKGFGESNLMYSVITAVVWVCVHGYTQRDFNYKFQNVILL